MGSKLAVIASLKFPYKDSLAILISVIPMAPMDSLEFPFQGEFEIMLASVKLMCIKTFVDIYNLGEKS